MIKSLLTLALMLFIPSLLYAQSFYFKVGTGANFPQAGAILDNTSFPLAGTITNTNGGYDYQLNKTSFSAGWDGTLGFGYMFNKHFGIELTTMIGLVNKKSTGSLLNDSSSGTPQNIYIVQYAKNPVLLNPSFVLESGGDDFDVYMRMGLAIPIISKIISEQTQTEDPAVGSYTQTAVWEIKNNFSLGYTGALGIKYKLTDNCSAWCEVNILSMALYPQQADMTSASVNGAAYPLQNIPAYNRTVVFGTNISSANSITQSQPTYLLPYSNIGLHIGLMFKLKNNASHRYHKAILKNYNRN